MRSYLVALIIFGTFPFILKLPHVGLYVYSWISYMNPHRLTWGFAYNFQFALIVGSLMIFSWLISREPKKLPINGVTALILFFTLWLTASSFFAMDPEAAMFKWKQVIKIMFVTLLTVIIIERRERLDGLVWVIVCSIGYFAIKGGIFAILTGGAYRIWGPPQSLIEENNALAVATVMIVPFARYLQLQARNRYLRLALLGSLPVMVISALASYSRGALIAISAMGLFLWLKSRHKLALGLMIAGMIALGAFFMPQQWYDRMDTIDSYEEDASALGRLNAWAMGFNLALDHPFLGGGFGAYGVPEAWESYAPNPADQHAAHSVYFEVLAYHGFVGLAAFLATGFLAFRYGSWVIRRCKDRPDLTWARDLAAMTQVSLIGFATGGAFLNLAFFDLFWHIVAISAALRLVIGRVLVLDPASAADRNAEAPMSGPVASPAGARSFLRDGASPANRRSFIRS